MAGAETSRPPLILIANDEEWWTRSLESFLAPAGYAILKAYTGQQAMERAHEATLDVIFLDASLPDVPGVELCRKLRADGQITHATPILITTAGRVTRGERLEALAAGAWDFLGLPLDADDLLLRLDGWVRAKLDADRVRDESLTDTLTGLYNLRGLMQRAQELGSYAYRHGRSLACVAFAPQLEPQAGDDNGEWSPTYRQAVDHVAAILRTQGRVSDAIGRVREGEFVILAPATSEAGAQKLAERLVQTVGEAAAGSEGAAGVRLLAGYDVVPDFRSAGVQPSALLASATTALRRLQANPGESVILRYEGTRDELVS